MRIRALAAPPLTLARMLVLVVLVLKTFVGGRAHVPLESETAQIAWYMNVGVAKRAKGNQCSFGQWRDRELAPSCLPCMEYGVFLQTKLYGPDDGVRPPSQSTMSFRQSGAVRETASQQCNNVLIVYIIQCQ